MKFQFRTGLIFSLLLLTLVGVRPSIGSAAQLGTGTLEFRGSADWEHIKLEEDGGGLTTAGLQLGLGRALNDRFMVGGSVLFDHASVDTEAGSGFSESSFQLAGDLTLNLSADGPIVPFASLSVGFISWSGSGGSPATTLVLPFAGAGFRVLVGEYASANFAAGVERQQDALGVDGLSALGFLARFSLSVYPHGIQ